MGTKLEEIHGLDFFGKETVQENSGETKEAASHYYNSPKCLSVGVTVSKLQIAILARSSREMSQIVRID